MPEVYLSTVIFTSIAIALVCWGIIGIFFMPEVGVIAFWESLQDPATINPCLDWEYWEPELLTNQNLAMVVLSMPQEYSLHHLSS